MSTPRRARVRRPPPEPLRSRDLPVVLAGTALWGIGLIATFIASDALTEAAWTRWFWACAAGIFLGAIGVRHVKRHERTLRDEKAVTVGADIHVPEEPPQ